MKAWLPGCGLALGFVGLALCPHPRTVLLVPKHLPSPELGHNLCWEDEDPSPPQNAAYGVVAQAWEGMCCPQPWNWWERKKMPFSDFPSRMCFSISTLSAQRGGSWKRAYVTGSAPCQRCNTLIQRWHGVGDGWDLRHGVTCSLSFLGCF